MTKFRGELELAGKTATGFVVPDAVVEELGAGRRPPVVVTINGASFRTSIASMGGQFLLGVSAANRELTGTKAGGVYDVEVEVDTEPRVLEVPDDLAAAFDQSPAAKTFYETLSYSQQRRVVEPVRDAKTEETRARRIAAMVAKLADGVKP
jgi:hypothetical protein